MFSFIRNPVAVFRDGRGIVDGGRCLHRILDRVAVLVEEESRVHNGACRFWELAACERCLPLLYGSVHTTRISAGGLYDFKLHGIVILS